MKKLAPVLAAALAILSADRASAQFNQATTSANASASIVTAISLAKTADLAFGDAVAGGTAGTVVVTPAGARSATGGTTLGSSSGVSAASFTVTGDPSSTYSITLPGSTTLTFAVINTMTANTFTSNPSSTGTLSAGGSQTLTVGATLNVGASQAAGTYTGSFNVTVAYN